VVRNWLAIALLVALYNPHPALAQETTPTLTFVDASTNKPRGPQAVDGDRRTAWIGLARRKGAWITFKLPAPTRLLGLRVETGPMPVGTFYRIETSVDGEHFATVLDDLRNDASGPALRPFDPVREARFVRLTFFNGAHEPVTPFSLFEVSALPEPEASLVNAPTASTPITSLPLFETPVATPSPRLHGVVLGTWDGRKVAIVVGDGFSRPVDAVKLDGHPLRVIDMTGTQILCEYPFGRSPHMTIVLQQGRTKVTRTVAPVHRTIVWVSPSPVPIKP